MTSTDFKETLKLQADIVRIVGDYVKLKKSGAQNYTGLCPFHSEKTPSFSVHATRQFYHCFGCGASGDVFSFVQKVENLSFPETIRVIAQKIGVPLPKITHSSPEEARDARLRSALYEIHEKACEFFQTYLNRPEGARAREYLARRGLDARTIARFQIGYAPDSGFVLRDALKSRFDEEVLRASGLFSWKQEENRSPGLGGSSQQSKFQLPAVSDHKQQVLRSAQNDNKEDAGHGAQHQQPRASLSALYSKFRNRIMFPITNDAGRVIAFTGRSLSADEKSGPKYLNSPETPIYSKSRVLFNLDKAKEYIRKEYAILVEGQMDCISVFAAGFENVIASSGTAFTEAQAKLLGRFSKNVIVNFDPDTAGAKATERTLGLLVEEEFDVRVATLEPGFDPDLYIRRKGKEAYGVALKHSQKYFDYLIERARTQFPVRSAEGKVKALNYLLPHIQRVPNRIIRDNLVAEIAQKLDIDSALVRQELKHVASSRSSTTLKALPETQVTDAERILIRALTSASEMQPGEEHLSARDGAEEAFDPARQAQFALRRERIYEGLATESLIDALLNSGERLTDITSLPSSEADRRLLASILMKEDEELTAERVEGAVRALLRISYRRKLEQIQRELESGSSADSERRRSLLEEKVRIKRTLMDPGLADGSADPAA